MFPEYTRTLVSSLAPKPSGPVPDCDRIHRVIAMYGRPQPPSGVAWYAAVRSITQKTQPGDNRSDNPDK